MKSSLILGCNVVISPGFVEPVVQLDFVSSCIHFLFLLSGCQLQITTVSVSFLLGYHCLLKIQKANDQIHENWVSKPLLEHLLFLY